MCRFALRITNAPPMIISASGTSLAMVVVTTKRRPYRTPIALIPSIKSGAGA